MSFTWESKVTCSHSWLDFNWSSDFNNFVSVGSTECVSFEVNVLLAAVKEFFKSAFNGHMQVTSLSWWLCQLLYSANLVAFIIKSDGEWVFCAEKLLKDLECVAREAISTSLNRLVFLWVLALLWGDSSLKHFFTIAIIDLSQFGYKNNCKNQTDYHCWELHMLRRPVPAWSLLKRPDLPIVSVGDKW